MCRIELDDRLIVLILVHTVNAHQQAAREKQKVLREYQVRSCAGGEVEHARGVLVSGEVLLLVDIWINDANEVCVEVLKEQSGY